MRILLASLLLALAVGPAAFAQSAPPLKIDVPPGWKLIVPGAPDMRCYVNGPADADTGKVSNVLMFTRRKERAGEIPLPEAVEASAKFIHENDSSGNFGEYKLSKINGRYFHGDCAVFQMAKNYVSASFLITDGGYIWVGQFIGTEENWKIALRVVEQLKTLE